MPDSKPERRRQQRQAQARAGAGSRPAHMLTTSIECIMAELKEARH